MSTIKLDTTDLHIKLKNSLLCGLKGSVIFCLANITLSYNSAHSFFFKKNSRFLVSENEEYRTSYKNIKNQIIHNSVPLLETIIIMPTAFIVTHYIVGKLAFHGQFNPIKMYLSCLGICMVIMTIICLTLRLLQKRKDACCDQIAHPIYRNSQCQDNSFINFTNPYGNETRTTLGCKAKAKLKSLMPNKKSCKIISGIQAILFSILMIPITAIKIILEFSLLVLEILELPLSLILDIGIMAYEISTEAKDTSQFEHSRNNVNRITSLLYAVIRDSVILWSFGLLDAEFIQKNGHKKSPMSYIDKIFTEPTTTKKPTQSKCCSQTT